MSHVQSPGPGSPKLAIRLGDSLERAFEASDLTTHRAAVALLRTVFEDHYVDPEHNWQPILPVRHPSAAQPDYDFSVIHRGWNVVLSDFTFPHRGPERVTLPLAAYVREVVRFGEAVLAAPPVCRNYRDSESEALARYRQYLLDLIGLGRAALGGHNYWELCEEFHMIHGSLKRPLHLRVVDILDHGGGRLRAPQIAVVEVCFGPLHDGEKTALRINRGDVVLATVLAIEPAGATLRLEGIGPGGLFVGDELFGLQCFYP
jgi:hypothetical protein